jgi:hypothetical protein
MTTQKSMKNFLFLFPFSKFSLNIFNSISVGLCNTIFIFSFILLYKILKVFIFTNYPLMAFIIIFGNNPNTTHKIRIEINSVVSFFCKSIKLYSKKFLF